MSSTTLQNTILITGGTTGLGYEAALSLAKRFPKHQILVASRSNKTAADTSINTTLHQSNTQYLPLDLSSQANIRSFASTIASTYPPIIHLLLNAGLQFPGPVSYYPNGIEKTFAVNHLGHALLFYLLLPHLTSTASITITASSTHDPARKTRLPDAEYTNFASLSRPDPANAHKNGLQRYASSKLVNVMWTYALARHLKSASKSGMKVNAFDPGLMPGTGLAREYNPAVRFLWNHVLPRILPVVRLLTGNSNVHTTQESGASLAWLAIGEGVDGEDGKYFEGKRVVKSSIESFDEVKQEELYSETIKELAEGDEAARWEKLQ